MQLWNFNVCAICLNNLNNVDGPGPGINCTQNCNDAITVCSNGHIFHRGCILLACSIKAIYPLCSQNLLKTNGNARLCNKLYYQSQLFEQKLIAMIGGSLSNNNNLQDNYGARLPRPEKDIADVKQNIQSKHKDDYSKKYIKYKNKYLQLKNQKL